VKAEEVQNHCDHTGHALPLMAAAQAQVQAPAQAVAAARADANAEAANARLERQVRQLSDDVAQLTRLVTTLVPNAPAPDVHAVV
jgi:hypothetical protein